jgi:chromosome partitioning protein
MIRLVVSNQRGGVAKTTTAITLARCFADRGMKVLLVDTDPQGSVSAILGLKPEYFLYDFLVKQLAFRECIFPAHRNIDIIASNRQTTEAEDIISAQMLREVAFETVFSPHEAGYEVLIIDVAPSITLFQACAMVYAKQVLIPVGMETLSLQGATASIQAAESLNHLFKRVPPVKTVGILPVMVDRRLAMTDTVLDTLQVLSSRHDVPILPVIRTDTAVVKAGRHRRFLADYDPKSKALEDYQKTADELLSRLQVSKDAAVQA